MFYNPLVPCFLAAIVGILICRWIFVPIWIWTILFFLVLILLILLRNYISYNFTGVLFVCVLMVTLFGFRCQYYTHVFPENDLGRQARRERRPIQMRGWIAEQPACRVPVPSLLGQNIEKTGVTRCVAVVDQIRDRGNWIDSSGKTFLSISEEITWLKVGDYFELEGFFSRPQSAGNPYEFDRRDYLLSRRITTETSVNSSLNIRLVRAKDRWLIARWFAELRLFSAQIFDNRLSSSNAALAKAMILGIRDDLDEEFLERFKETGMVHLLAISGLHLSIVAGFCLLILQFCGCSIRTKYIILGLVICFYLALTDMKPPVIRAAILILVFCVGNIFSYNAFGVNSLVLAALILLMYNPCELFNFGTQLSFLATGIFFWLPGFDNILTTSRLHVVKEKDEEDTLAKETRDEEGVFSTFMKYLLTVEWGRLLITSGTFLMKLFFDCLVIWLVLLPLIANKVNLLTPIALLINPLIILPLSFALNTAVLLMVTSWLLPWELTCLSWLTDKTFDLFLNILTWAHSCPYGCFQVACPSDIWCLGFYIPLVIATLYPEIRYYWKQIFIFLGLWTVGGLMIVGITRYQTQRNDVLHIQIVSVGHGSAFILQYPDNRIILFDCGSFSSPHRAGSTIARTLWNMGVSKVDIVVFSHADSDHYNAFEQIAEQFTVGTVIVSPIMFEKQNEFVQTLKHLLEEKKIPIHTCSGGDTLAEFGFSEIRFLHPILNDWSRISATRTNENSLVMMVEHLGRHILFPGDLDMEAAAFLNEKPVKLEVLLSPHHGGNSDGYQELLDWGKPDWVIISGGSFQRNPDSEQELKEKGITVYNTFDTGAVFIDIQKSKEGKGTISVTTFRKNMAL